MDECLLKFANKTSRLKMASQLLYFLKILVVSEYFGTLSIIRTYCMAVHHIQISCSVVMSHQATSGLSEVESFGGRVFRRSGLSEVESVGGRVFQRSSLSEVESLRGRISQRSSLSEVESRRDRIFQRSSLFEVESLRG